MAWDRAATEQVIAAFQAGMPHAKVVRFAGTNHYVFLADEAGVLRQMRLFLAGVK